MTTPPSRRSPMQVVVMTLAGVVLAAIACGLVLALIEAFSGSRPLTDLLRGAGWL